MSSEKFQEAHHSICHSGAKLLKYLEEIRQSRLSEGDDSKSLQSIEDDIHKALSALKEQKYQVAVIAAMKAGKSTFLNAVIGADVLASESAACTICRTDVRHIPDGQVPRLLEYREGQRQGLLAKLIQQERATENQVRDFKKFFSARYATEDEEGNQIIPAPRKIAPQALKDSGIITIEQTVIQTITQNSGWNLLSDAVAKIDKAGKGIEDTLNTQISGWQIGIEALKQKVEEYTKRSDYAKSKVEAVKKSVDEQKQILISGFSQAISEFAEGAKAKIEAEIDLIGESVSDKKIPKKTQKKAEILIKNVDIPSTEVKVGFSLPSWIPFIGGTAFTFETKTPLVEALTKALPTPLANQNSNEYKSLDPYKIRLNTKEEAKKFERTINEFCAPHMKTWWLDTQDKLVRDGTRIREELVDKIKDDIQQISNELSNYLGEALQVELNVNPIQFPSFDFPGIDAQVQYQQELYKKKETQNYSTGEKRNSCEGKQDYTKRTTKEREVEVEKQRSFYEVNLRETVEVIKVNIDSQASGSRELLQRVIEKQVAEDFKNAEQQINDYIQRFQDEFDRLLKERETKETEGDRIREMLKIQKAQLNQYLHELTTIKASLHNWKPMQTIK